MTRSVGPCKRCGGPVLHSHQYVNLRGGIRHITCTPRNRARVVIAAGALGLAVVGTACVPPPPPATLIPPALLRACNGPVVTFMEGYPVPCDVVLPPSCTAGDGRCTLAVVLLIRAPHHVPDPWR